MILSKGTIISNRYEILEVLGKGGMAVAYRAKDSKLGREVTVKVLREDFIEDQDFIEKFRTEARSAASLSHPNIVNVYDVGNDDKIYYIVMEYIHGDDLKRAIEVSAPFDSLTVLSISIQIASALSHAHRHNIVHRDIKPQNILLSMDGTTKVTDFGVARAISGATMATAANAVGSVHYFSPEQARGGYVDEKSDIYSLGITMFEMVTGTLPFDGDNSVAVALMHLKEQLPDMRQFNPKISPAVEGIIKKATKKKTDERYENVDLLLADLKKALVEITESAVGISGKGTPSSMATEAAATVGARTMSDKVVEITEFKSRGEALSSLELDDIPRKEIKYSKKQMRQIEKNSKLQISKDDSYEEDYVPSKKAPKKYSDGYDENKEKKVIIAAVLTALIIIAVITLAGINFLKGDGGFGGKVTVPTLLGITLEEAENIGKNLGVDIVKKGEEVSETYKEGLIMFQSIAEGDVIAKDDVIDVIISLGAGEYNMPDVVYMQEKEAATKIKNIVPVSIKIVQEYKEGIEEGVVLKQDPSEGTKISSDTLITLTVSKGKDIKTVAVPNIIGKTESDAKSSLEAVKLKLGEVTKASSETVEEGKIISQGVFAGDEVDEGSSITAVVSTGKEKDPENTDNTDPGNTENPDNTGTENGGNASTPKTVTVTIQPANLPQTSDAVRVELVKIGSSGQMETITNEVKDTADFPYYVNVTGTGSAELQLYVDGVLQWSKNVQF